MTKAEERALEAYPIKMVSGPYSFQESKFDLNAFGRYIFQEGYEQAEKDISALIESIIEGILGDAHPKPALRAELQELITRIKNNENPNR